MLDQILLIGDSERRSASAQTIEGAEVRVVFRGMRS